MDELNEIDVQIIRAMAECDMRTCAVADKLHYCQSAINYRLRRIKRITGLNPHGFFDLQELLKMVGGSNG
jgi:sugar diacid utilization regulator